MQNEYISRKSIQDRLHRIIEVNKLRPDRAWFTPNGVEALIDEIPPANVQPVVRGHWVWNPNGMDWGLGSWCCDQCRIKAETWWANDRKNNPLRCSGGRFCGNCGANMRPEPAKEADNAR
jgi:hypothetical protein